MAVQRAVARDAMRVELTVDLLELQSVAAKALSWAVESAVALAASWAACSGAKLAVEMAVKRAAS